MSEQFPISPYFDDFSEDNNFYKLLFRPGYALQTRELNQLQSILQNQIEKVGNHLFKDGAMIIPGNISFINDVDCIKVQSTNVVLEKVSLFLTDFVDTIITGSVSGAEALVSHVETEVGGEYNTLYIKYTKSGTISSGFLDDEILTNDATTPLTCTTITSSSSSFGSLAVIQQGVYYIKGYFVSVATETISLDKYGVTPSYKVGLNITETVITPDDDETLNDNAIGTYNYYAPGSHRYKITTSLVKLDLDSILDSTFIELLRVNLGVVEKRVTTTEYAFLEDTLARRTYDESGDYTVNPFDIQLKEDRNNDRGERVNSTAYLQGDVIEYTTGGKTYTYECIISGTSGSTIPTYVYTFGSFTDGGVTWDYTEKPTYNLGVKDASVGTEATFDVVVGSGKAYVKGYELEKLTSTYVNVNKSRSFERVNSSNLTTYTDTYVLVKNLYSIPEIPFAKVDLYNTFTATPGSASGTKVGTATVSSIEKNPDISGTYKVFLFNIVLLPTKTIQKDVRQLYYNNTTLSLDFTANVYPTIILLTGSISSSGTAVTGVGTRFTSELISGDYITIDNVNFYRVNGAPSTDRALTLASAPSTITGSAFYNAISVVNNANIVSNVVNFPNLYIRNVKSDDDINNDTNYTITRNFAALTSNGSGVITITLSVSGESFASVGNSVNYLFVNNSTGAVLATPTLSVNGDSTILTASGLATTIAYNVTVSINKTAAQRSKTIHKATLDVTTSALVHKSFTYLLPDCYRLLSVKLAPAFGTITTGGANDATVDITNNFKFDNGQRATHYDLGSISLKAGYIPSHGSIRIVYEYFTHGVGDYFSVDSYKNVIPYSAIPSEVRDSLDFRPIINDNGLGFNIANTGILKNGFNILADYSYYLGRCDILSLDTTGVFFITSGVPSLNPKAPIVNKQAMNIAVIYLAPYGIDMSTNSIITSIIDNKRYTMRDIGALEKRIDNIEYYTSLSLLEQETKSLSIPDEFGLERYKNGFIVDNFSDHGVGAVDSLDYVCGVDIDTQELRSTNNTRNLDLHEENVNMAQRIVDGYTMTGDIITLPYTNKLLISQMFASRVKNVNPFAIFTFIGNAKFIPSSDNWFEEKNNPDIVANKEGNYLQTIESLKAKGILGDKWDSWKINWTGITTKKNHWWTNAAGSTIKVIPGVLYMNVFEKSNTETTTTTKKTRSGINTSVTAKFDVKVVDDKIISTSNIPYMRQRNILFLCRGLKPNTIFYPFFDNISISSYITSATRLTITSISGYSSVFDYNTNVGGDITETARMFNNKIDTSLTSGDVVKGRTSGATGIVALHEITSTGAIYVHIVNVKGTFILNEIIDGSISSARGLVSLITTGTSTLTSNANGDVVGVFNVPNTDRLRFKCGNREFRLTTEVDNGLEYKSIIKGIFTANGILQVKQKTIESVRNAIVVQKPINGSVEEISSSTSKTKSTWYEPIAQTFLIQQPGGAFLTKVEIFFATKDANIPVKLEIREVVNGYPGQTILPFAEVSLTPDKVKLSNSLVTVGGTTYSKDDIATSFVFESPVYVKDNTEYCIVLISDSNNYNIWISQLGEKQVGSDRYISEQPYAGSLFESQNASTWTANQLQDFKFAIYRAKFTTNVSGAIKFINTILPPDSLEVDPLQTTNGSNVVRVYHYNHGMENGSYVTISGIAAGTYNNIPSTQLNGTKVIANVVLDSYTITTTASANASGFIGEDAVLATFNTKYDSIEPSIQTLDFPEASIDYDMKTTSSNYVIDSIAGSFDIGNTLDMNSSKIVASAVNETTFLSSSKSLAITARIISTNDSVSPVIDTHRASAICITNRINDPTIALNISPIDYRVLHAGASNLISVDDTNDYFQTSDSGLQAIFTSTMAGKYITITGCVVSGNNGVHLITEVAADGSYIKVATDLASEASTVIAMSIADYFIDETAALNSSSLSKYVSKIISLENQSTSVKVMFAYTKPVEANIEVYYRIGNSSALDVVDNSTYTLITNAGLISTTDTTSYSDTSYELTNLPAFTAIQIKIVMRSSDTSKVPKLKDLRIIALA